MILLRRERDTARHAYPTDGDFTPEDLEELLEEALPAEDTIVHQVRATSDDREDDDLSWLL